MEYRAGEIFRWEDRTTTTTVAADRRGSVIEAYLPGMKGSHGSLSRASNSAGVIIV